MTDVLTLSGVHTFINQFHILEGVDFTVPAGSITVLLGRNGAGKTTTLRTIMGMTPPSAGDVLFNGASIKSRAPYTIARLGVGYVPEHRAIFRELTVLENLRISERAKGDLDRTSDFIFRLFPDLKRLVTLRGGSLSGGQQQMLAVARALVSDNHLLLIDEPSEGLAPVIIEQLMAAIRELAADKTVLLVEQNFRVASRLADRYVIIDDGHSVQSGLMPDLIQDEAAVQRYLGVA
ncbi:MAG: ABC transporter ATP-binding protein [Chloroflexi bacterium]|jgi:branched-chain amino acid transport system ATP-binding protein|nr:ABC transporter ATP-binding protein [Chloroflexota bacterium]MCO6445054.1 ABC transporter ATP-binding protein [Anaerolineae bacterium]MDL1914596.1 ABC transporter ATP-binding protein [Anaerolineae bacterium CFX4]OQY85833.1 MAG: ABC transporter ATP-binding protein [Anaerolineae bacterium UTCFX5]RIK23230.1 MAG: ABC transporter ATP-binding protein [Chloroflexota bacterium]